MSDACPPAARWCELVRLGCSEVHSVRSELSGVNQRHAVRFFLDGHEPQAGSAAALAIAAADAAESQVADVFVTACRSRHCRAGNHTAREAELQAESAHQRGEIE